MSVKPDLSADQIGVKNPGGPAETARKNGAARPPPDARHARGRPRRRSHDMDEINHVVAHFIDGSVRKGTTEDFSPNRPSFHVHPIGGGAAEEIQCQKLKAVFFVDDLNGNPDRRDIPGFLLGPGETNLGKKVAVRFKDKELIFGYTLSYSRERSGFFLTPADPGSNNLRIYVLHHAALEVKVGPAADVLAQQTQEREAA
jgi:hypothetical protein